MPFWVYMLHCRDRTFYVGHTDDLEARITRHQQGLLGGYTARKRPVSLVWSAELPTREEAMAFERRIKGWRREKKLALIRGDWGEIGRLARERKGRPSTSSGRPGEEANRSDPPSGHSGFLEERSLFLQRHPSTPCEAATSLEVRLSQTPAALRLRYILTADTRAIVIPAPAPSRRRDELWRHTCFELFSAPPHGGYSEFNFAPSSEWAAYSFRAYRAGMEPLETSPRVTARIARRSLVVQVVTPLPDPGPLHLNLAAVIEEKSGAKSYWALAHPPDGPPDFHHPDCFVLKLPPRSGA